MKRQEQILNWLMIGFEQPIGSLTELFYYDRLSNLFFTIHVSDYFMLDENLDIAPNVTSSYSQDTQEAIVGWIKRIDKKDSQIIYIPRLTQSEREEGYDHNFLLLKAETFLNLNNIDIETAKVWEVE